MIKSLLLSLSVVAFAACQSNPCGLSKNKFLDNYEKFVDDVADLELSSDAKAWKKYDDRFEQFTDECYPRFEDKLSNREKRAFAGHTVEYMVNRYGVSFFRGLENDEELEEDLREIGESIGRYAEKMGDEFSKAINDLVNEIDREALEEAVDKARDFFENLDINIDYNKDDK
ncbi:MAG: DUF6565 domain-containing protein [Saprospiraceae bacterium]|nr:DUF6565 domain-containing protein [Saprospiraceae bacterium]